MKDPSHIGECADPAPFNFVPMLVDNDPGIPAERDWLETWPADEYLSPHVDTEPMARSQYDEAEPWLLSDLGQNLARTSSGHEIEYLEALARWRACESDEIVLVRARVKEREEILLINFYDDGRDVVGISTTALVVGEGGKVVLEAI